ncbi:MAG: hypothetical protein V9G19_09370 [Tetrasphaera sp.]
MLCTFWLVSAYAWLRRRDEAGALMDTVLRLSGPLGLCAEELEAGGEMLGKLPQVFSQLDLVIAALDLEDSLREGGCS